MAEMELVYLSPHELTAYENNTRKHAPKDIEQIKESILADGFNDPIGVWGDKNIIVEGHGRQIAAIELGLEKIPCIRLDHLTDTQRRDYAIRHNRTAELSEWDFGKLEEEIARLEIEGVDLSGLEFDLDSIGGAATDTTAVNEDFVPELPNDPITKAGDIWQLGEHRLMCGDSTDSESINKLFDGETADITLTSPPYGMSRTAHLRKKLRKGYSGRDGKTFYGENEDDMDEWYELMQGFFKEAQMVSKAQFINIMMVADNKMQLVDFIHGNKNALVDIIVWNKHTCPPQIHENVLNNGYEFVFVFDNENNTRKIRFGDFKGSQSNYIETDKQQNEYADIHKAVFGTKFVEKILDMNGLAKSVYEPFAGTGTTLIVCEERGLKSYCMELNPAYCDVIIQRWEEFTGEKAVLLNE